ncbi:hypothetical protein ACFIOY_22445 [Bradyrhizobium sp. TZ2]
MPPQPDNLCKWVDQQTALRNFATFEEATQSQRHIKPLHHYVACRLVLEGGFLPEEITLVLLSALKSEKASGIFRMTERSRAAANKPFSAGLRQKMSM